MTRIIKTCACGRAYSRETWRELRQVGKMDDGNGGQLVLADCVCRSTIAVDESDLGDWTDHIVTDNDRSRGRAAAAAYLAKTKLAGDLAAALRKVAR